MLRTLFKSVKAIWLQVGMEQFLQTPKEMGEWLENNSSKSNE